MRAAHDNCGNILEGRFVIEARHAGLHWEVIVEPDEVRRFLVVITAYPVERAESRRNPTSKLRSGMADHSRRTTIFRAMRIRRVLDRGESSPV